MNRRELLTRVIAIKGRNSQLNKAVQELLELSVEINKNLEGRDNYTELIEELVDARIMLDQVLMLVDETDYKEVEKVKLMRLKERLLAWEMSKPAHHPV